MKNRRKKVIINGKNILRESLLYLMNKTIKISKSHGFGFVISKKNIMEKFTLPLRPSTERKVVCTLNKKIKESNSVSRLLLRLSFSKNFHDGFHFLNLSETPNQQTWRFIGICRMLLVKKSKLKPHEKKGARYYSAKIFSSYKGVEFVGIITSQRNAFYFIEGKSFKLFLRRG